MLPMGQETGTGAMRAMPVMATFYAVKKDYEDSLQDLDPESEEYERTMHELHQRSAPKCLQIAKANGGIYNKAAQFVSSLQGGAGDKGIPKEYIEVLSVLTDKAPPRPFEDVKFVVEEEFGRPLGEIFLEFDEAPLATASLAQVHRAKLTNGKEVAVKVQHKGLGAQMASDLGFMKTMGASVKPGGHDLTWLVEDFTTALNMEMDFIGEGAHGERARCVTRHIPGVKVPAVLWDLTTTRVLTMEYVPNMVKVDDPEAVKAAGMEPAVVGDLLGRAFGELTFRFGVVHGDPHNGNVYCRKNGEETEIIILDHGLYHLIDHHLRQRLCRLFKACVLRQMDEITELSTSFAGEKLQRFFPLILSPWFIFGGSLKPSDLVAAHERRLPGDVTYKDIGEVLLGLHDTSGTKLLGVLHSLGYIRGLMNGTQTPEKARLMHFSRAVALGLEEDTDFSAEQPMELGEQVEHEIGTPDERKAEALAKVEGWEGFAPPGITDVKETRISELTGAVESIGRIIGFLTALMPVLLKVPFLTDALARSEGLPQKVALVVAVLFVCVIYAMWA